MVPFPIMFSAVGAFAKKFLGGPKGITIVLLVGVIMGFWISQKFFLPDPVKEVEYVYEVIEKQQEAEREIVEDHNERLTEIKIVKEFVPVEVVKYVPKEADPVECNIPIGSVRLLNDAREGRIREGSLQGATGATDGEGAAPSTVTRRDLIQSDAEIAIQYNEVVNQLNSLIDWIEAQQKSLDQ